MGIMDDYKQLQMIENVKKIKEMELCYKSNLKLCKYQERQINKLANCIEEIKEIAESEMDSKEFMAVQCMLNGGVDNKNKVLKQILQKISECEANQ